MPMARPLTGDKYIEGFGPGYSDRRRLEWRWDRRPRRLPQGHLVFDANVTTSLISATVFHPAPHDRPFAGDFNGDGIDEMAPIRRLFPRTQASTCRREIVRGRRQPVYGNHRAVAVEEWRMPKLMTKLKDKARRERVIDPNALFRALDFVLPRHLPFDIRFLPWRSDTSLHVHIADLLPLRSSSTRPGDVADASPRLGASGAPPISWGR